MTPYKKHIFICENRRDPKLPKGCCQAKGGSELKKQLKLNLAQRGLNKIFRANTAGCLGACEHGAVIVIYPQSIWYGHVALDDLDEIIERSILHDEIIQRLLIEEQVDEKASTS